MNENPDADEVHRRLEAIIERISHIVYIKDPEGRYLLMNSAGEALFERPREEIVGARDGELFAPEEAEEIRSIDETILETGEPATYESRRTVLGEERVFLNEKYPYRPDGDAVRGVLGISKDVTDERRRQRALERLHEATRELLAARTDAEIAEHASEASAEILDLPSNTVHLYDADTDALVPVAWSDPRGLLDGDRPPAYPAGEGIAWQVFTDGETRSYTDVREADAVFNPETPVRSEIILPLGDHGVLMIGSLDVDAFEESDEALAEVLASNVRAALDRVEREEELRRRNDRLEDFASVVSHDIRNPLNLAQTATQLVAEDCESGQLDRLRDAHARIDAVIDDVMVWARQGQTIEETVPVDVGRLAERCWGGSSTEAATLVVEDDLVIAADRERFRRVLENLFRNAVEHGGPEVTVRVGRLDDAAGFYVADDGPGIPPAERSMVFETGYSTSSSGTGFGLAICRQIAAAHGWSVSATESDTGGARFEFRGVDVRDG